LEGTVNGRWLVNVVLFALLMLLGSGVRHELTKVSETPRLSDLVPTDLLQVEIVREGEPTIRFNETATGWRIEEPLKVDAEQGQMDKLLAILRTPVHRSIPAQTADLRELGLSPPTLRARFDSLALSIGGVDPVAQYRYVSSDGIVHLIDDRFYHLLIAPPIDYVSRRLFPRGFAPAFGRIDGVPLKSDSLASLEGVVAERIEPLPGDFTGSPAEIKIADGTGVRFLVSGDRRRWARQDLRLLYVLTTAPTLTQDPNAVDPTPPIPEPQVAVPEPTAPPEDIPEEATYDPADPFSPIPEGEEPLVQDDSSDAPIEGGPTLGPAPAVHLSPNGQPRDDGKATATPAKTTSRQNKLHAEPDPKGAFGFGQDPFAPDPAQH
jgi:hypothetical protein